MEITADSVVIIDGYEYAGDYIIKLMRRREKELEQWRVKAKRQYKKKVENLSTELSTLRIIPEIIQSQILPERLPERFQSQILPERIPHQQYNSQYRDDSLNILPEYIKRSVLQREKDGTGIKIPKLHTNINL